jgi:hypothetical protein
VSYESEVEQGSAADPFCDECGDRHGAGECIYDNSACRRCGHPKYDHVGVYRCLHEPEKCRCSGYEGDE